MLGKISNIKLINKLDETNWSITIVDKDIYVIAEITLSIIQK